MWFGWVTWLTERSLGFDLACLYTGARATEVAAERGVETYESPFITNDSPSVRTVPIAPDTPVRETWFFVRPSGDHVGPYSDWPESTRGSLCSPSLDFCSVWIAVNDGSVTEVVESPVPSDIMLNQGLAAAGSGFTPADGQYVTEPRIDLTWTHHQFQPRLKSINGWMVSAYTCFEQESIGGVWRCPVGEVPEWPAWTQHWAEGINTIEVTLIMDQRIVLAEQRNVHLMASLAVTSGRVTNQDAHTTTLELSEHGPSVFTVSPNAVVLFVDPITYVPASSVVPLAHADPSEIVGRFFDVYTTGDGTVIQLVQRW